MMCEGEGRDDEARSWGTFFLETGIRSTMLSGFAAFLNAWETGFRLCRRRYYASSRRPCPFHCGHQYCTALLSADSLARRPAPAPGTPEQTGASTTTRLFLPPVNPSTNVDLGESTKMNKKWRMEASPTSRILTGEWAEDEAGTPVGGGTGPPLLSSCAPAYPSSRGRECSRYGEKSMV
jgi:hypothetical protein